jgi:hypothetical protein
MEHMLAGPAPLPERLLYHALAQIPVFFQEVKGLHFGVHFAVTFR